MWVTQTFAQSWRNEATVDGRVVRMSPQVSRLLSFMLIVGPRFSNAWEMSEYIWDHPDDTPLAMETVITVLLCSLRKFGVPVENKFGEGWRIPEYARTPDQYEFALAA